MAAAAEKPKLLRNSSGNPVCPDLWKCQSHYEISESEKAQGQTYRKPVNKWQGALHQRGHKVFLCLYYILEAIPSFIWNTPELNRACLYCLSDIPKIYSYPVQTVRYVASVFELELQYWPQALPSCWLCIRVGLIPAAASSSAPLSTKGKPGRVGKAGAVVYTLNRFPMWMPRNAVPGIVMILCFPNQVRLTHSYAIPLSNTKLFCLWITNPFYLLKTEGVYCKNVLGSKIRSLMKN